MTPCAGRSRPPTRSTRSRTSATRPSPSRSMPARAHNVEAERKAREIRLRAERKAGALSAKLERSPGGRPGKTRATMDRVSTKAEQLHAAGVTPRQAKNWESSAAVPEEEFEAALADPTTERTALMPDDAECACPPCAAAAHRTSPPARQILANRGVPTAKPHHGSRCRFWF